MNVQLTPKMVLPQFGSCYGAAVSSENRRKQSRVRVFCAAKRTLYGEDDSLTLVGEGKGVEVLGGRRGFAPAVMRYFIKLT